MELGNSDFSCSSIYLPFSDFTPLTTYASATLKCLYTIPTGVQAVCTTFVMLEGWVPSNIMVFSAFLLCFFASVVPAAWDVPNLSYNQRPGWAGFQCHHLQKVFLCSLTPSQSQSSPQSMSTGPVLSTLVFTLCL